MRVYILLLLFAVGGTIVLTPIVRRFALTFNVLTPLRERDIHAVPTPRLGGIALTVAFAGAVLLGSRIPYLQAVYATPTIWAVVAGAGAMCLLGVIDDIWELDWMAKLGGQLLICGVMAVNGVQLVSFPVFGVTIGSSRLSIIVTVLVMVVTINAVNFIDGLDGLAAGVVAIGAGSFFSYSYLLTRLTNAPSYATVAAVLMITLFGVCLGFLWLNFHPASIFMGDSGAMVLGLVMSSAGIIVTGQIDPLVLDGRGALASLLPLLLPVVVLAVPLVNLVMTAMVRVFQGKSPFEADRTHLHDRLLDSGLSHRGVVVDLYLWTALACGLGVGLLLYSTPVIVGVGALLAALLVLVTYYVLPRWSFTEERTVSDDGIEIISRTQVGWRKHIRQVMKPDPTPEED